MEIAVFIGLEFCVLPTPPEVMAHFKQIQKSLGIVATPQRVVERSHCLSEEADHRATVLVE